MTRWIVIHESTSEVVFAVGPRLVILSIPVILFIALLRLLIRKRVAR